MLNLLQSTLLVGGMALLLSFSAELLFGGGVWPGVFAGVTLSLLLAPTVSPRWVLRAYRARELRYGDAPGLHRLVDELAARADLPRSPALYLVPGRVLNAFSVGSRADPAIAVTEGLIRSLDARELAGVLAHETSHIANNDMRIMALADTVTRMTHLLSMLGVLLAVLSLPLALFGLGFVSPWALLLLVAAPAVSALMQMALSRTREYLADLEAARLTGDPGGLASALGRLERQTTAPWRLLFGGGHGAGSDASLLRSHPATVERIRRLRELQPVAGSAGRRATPITGAFEPPRWWQ